MGSYVAMLIVRLPQQNQQWTGPLSRELLVFNSFVRSLTRSLRHLFEAVCVHLLLRGDARRAREDFVDIALSEWRRLGSGVSRSHCLNAPSPPGLPFQLEVNTGFGILAKTYIDATIAFFGGTLTAADIDKPEAKSAKEQAMGIVEETFVNVKSPRAEVERGFRFWDAVRVWAFARFMTRS